MARVVALLLLLAASARAAPAAAVTVSAPRSALGGGGAAAQAQAQAQVTAPASVPSASPYQRWWNVCVSDDGETVTGLTGGSNWSPDTPPGAAPTPLLLRSYDGGKTFVRYTDPGDLTPCDSDEADCATKALVCSADGAALAVAVNEGLVFEGEFSAKSGDFAFGPLPGAPEGSWKAAAMSANGSTLIVVPNDPKGCMYACDLSPTGGCEQLCSAEHFGGSTTAAQQQWNDVAMSSDGKTLVAAPWFGSGDASCGSGASHLFHSADGGESWAPGECFGFARLASSADGRTILVGEESYYGVVRVSVDGGTTWGGRSPVVVGATATTGWTAVAVSGDGSLLAVGDTYAIYISTDSGQSWADNLYDNNGRFWTSIAISNDASRIVAVSALYDNETALFQSADGGANWYRSTPSQDSAGGVSARASVVQQAVSAPLVLGSVYTKPPYRESRYVARESRA